MVLQRQSYERSGKGKEKQSNDAISDGKVEIRTVMQRRGM